MLKLRTIPYDSIIMIRAGAYTNAIKYGKDNLDIIKECRQHIVWMTEHGLSHSGFFDRYKRLINKYPNHSFSEIIAMGSGDKNNPKEGSALMFKLWQNSPEHRHALETHADIYGFSLGYAKGCWWGAGIIGKKI